MGELDAMVKQYTLADVRHGANKWRLAQQEKARLANMKRKIEAELDAVNKRLRS